MSCIPASHSVSAVLGQVDSQMDDSSVQRRGSRSYQIFPEANRNEEEDYPEDFLYRRERLPSIVVEPTEHGEPRPCHTSTDEQDEDDEASEEERSVDRKSSIGLSQSQLSLSRLTPPTSPTHIEAAPPCLKTPENNAD